MFKLFNLSMQPYMDGETDTGAGNTVSTETTTETQSTENTTTQETETQTETQTEQPKFKVKFNKEEMEIPYEEAVTHIQKGMNYDKAVERAKQEATDTWIANQGYEWNGKPITTEAQYKQALEQQAEQERRATLQEKGVDPTVLDEYLANHPTTRRAAELIKQQEQQRKQAAEYGEFLDYFRNENGRDFNPSTDQVPPEAWEMTSKGKSLADAYAMTTTKSLKAKIAELEAKFKAQETNTKNAESSPGSVTGNGEVKDTTLTPEMIESMTPQQLMARWGEVKKVTGMK